MLARALKSISIHSVLQPSSRKRTKAMFTDLTSKKKKKRQIHRDRKQRLKVYVKKFTTLSISKFTVQWHQVHSHCCVTLATIHLQNFSSCNFFI